MDTHEHLKQFQGTLDVFQKNIKERIEQERKEEQEEDNDVEGTDGDLAGVVIHRG